MKTKSGLVLTAGLLTLSLTQASRANDAYQVEGYHHEPYVTRQFQGHGMNNPYSSRRLRPFGYSQDHGRGYDDRGHHGWRQHDRGHHGQGHYDRGDRYRYPDYYNGYGNRGHDRRLRNPGYGMSLYYYR